MRLLLYREKGADPEGRLKAAIEEIVPDKRIEVLDTIPALDFRLRRLWGDGTVVVILCSPIKRLGDLIRLRELFEGMRVVLVLPNEDREVVQIAHQLRPRFIGSMDRDLSEVIAVLEKMLGPKTVAISNKAAV